MPRWVDSSSAACARPRLSVVVALLVALLPIVLCACTATSVPSAGPAPHDVTQPVNANDSILARALRDHTSGLEVQGRGTVSRILSDDAAGAKHQRFIVTLDSGQTILVAHNIDIAPRVAALRVGDAVSFKGEYEWNEQGGVVHWTHHDPAGSHEAGWIMRAGRTYQ